MNVIQLFEYGRKGLGGTPISERNTYIGGVASTINTPALLAAKLEYYPSGVAFNEVDIQDFTIVGNDIECLIAVDYQQAAYSFQGNLDITHYIDEGNNCKALKNSNFDASLTQKVGNLTRVKLEGLITTFGPCFRNQVKLKRFIFPNLTAMSSGEQFLKNIFNKSVVYAPLMTPIGQSALNNSVFDGTTGVRLYTDPSNQTNNAGNPDGDIADLISKGGTVSYISNYTAPSQITDLSIGNVYGSSIQLNFTPPTGSANNIDFYEVFLNGVYNNDITGSGQYATGLSLGTTYEIEVKPVDVFYNRSTSNLVTQATPAEYVIPATNIVAHYKMQNDVLDSKGTRHGTPTAITYAAGKAGNAAVFNGTTSKIAIDLSGLVTTKATFITWVKLPVHTPTVINKTGFIYINTANNENHYPYTDGNIYCSILTNTRKTIGAGAIADRTQWHMVTITANTVTNVWKFYQNKTLVTTSTVGSFSLLAASLIGKSNTTYYLDGLQDNVSILDKDISIEELTEIYNKENAGLELI